MQPQKWHTKFIAQLMGRGFAKEEAEDILDAGMGDHDYEDDPEDAANEELSYWTDDG